MSAKKPKPQPASGNVQLAEITKMIEGLDFAETARIHVVAGAIRELVAQHGDLGRMALALVGAELAAEE